MVVSILNAHGGLRGMLFELPEVIAKAEGAVAAAGLAGSCELRSGSFLESVPSGGDIYILSNILHDWDDDHCGRILTNCRRAMRRDAKILVIDAIMPEPDPPLVLAALDLQMMVMLGGKQRTESEYRTLFQASALRITQAQPQGLIEAEVI